jgi:hypothetical protein
MTPVFVFPGEVPSFIGSITGLTLQCRAHGRQHKAAVMADGRRYSSG